MKINRRKMAIFVGVILIVAGVLAYALHFRGKWAVARYKRQLIAAGEKLSVAELLASRVPPAQNMAPILQSAVSRFGTNAGALETNWPSAMRLVAPGKAMIRWMQSDIRSEAGTNTWLEIESALAGESEALVLLRQLTNRPALDFGIQYGQDFNQLRFLHLWPLKKVAQRLSAAATGDLRHQDTGSAAANLRAMLAVVKGTEEERFVISQLVRIALAQIAVAANWEFLQAPTVTDEQLAALQQDWMNLEFIRAGENALAMERATGQITLASWRSSPSGLQHYLDMWTEFSGSQEEPTAWDKIRNKARLLAWRLSWSYPDELRQLQGEQILLDSIRQVRTNHSFHAALAGQEDKIRKLFKPAAPDSDEFTGILADMLKTDLHSILSQSVPSLSHYLRRVMAVEAARQLTVTAIALKRYQLRHGSYPPDLSALVPEFLGSVPRDPVDGQPIRYRLNPDGTFLLYSIGEDGKDDDGDARPASGSDSVSWPRGRDYVWPSPATQKEIEAFEQKFVSKLN